MSYPWLYVLPVWLDGVVFYLVLGLAVELGFRVGLRKRKQWPDAEVGGGGVVLTALLAVLGLILAFTYSASASRFEARKMAVVNEANTLGTAFLRAGLVDEPGRTDLRQALLEYARTRVVENEDVTEAGGFSAIVDRSIRAQAKLWPLTERIVEGSARGPIEAGLVAAVNDVLDEHTIRIAAVVDRLPVVVILMLLLTASGALAVTGFNAGLSGRISRWRLAIFSLVLAGVMVVILDLDRPRTGFVTVSLDSLNALIDDMERVLAH